MELAVRPNRLASVFSRHYPGSVSDLTIMDERVKLHEKRLKKRDGDDHFNDN